MGGWGVGEGREGVGPSYDNGCGENISSTGLLPFFLQELWITAFVVSL